LIGMARSDRLALDGPGLTAIAALLDRPLVVLDVGCRDGVRPEWRALGPDASLIGFDADPVECARLNETVPDGARERYEPIALGATDGPATLHVTADPQCSSLYPPDEEYVRRYPELWRHAPRSTQTVVTSTLDTWAEHAGAGPVDALKIDVQGAELDVLRGAQRNLASVRLLELEVEFQPLYRGQPLFGDVDEYLRERGFTLWRLREIKHCRLSPTRRVEAPFAVGDAVERAGGGGQIAWANGVWVRNELADPDAREDWTVRARDACAAAIFDSPELVQLALAQAVDAAPPGPRATLADQLTRVGRRAARGRLRGSWRATPLLIHFLLRGRSLRR
jgi:FkbM family methyltransferase